MHTQPSSTAKTLILLFGACAFFAIFTTIDTAQYFRAWRAARSWTAVQQAVAPAMDASAIFAIIFLALVLETSVIVFASTGALLLGMAVATDGKRLMRAAGFLCAMAIATGLASSAALLFYFARLGSRSILKGPVFDYDLRLQPPVALALIAFPVLAIFGARALLALRGRQRSRRSPLPSSR